MVLPCERTQPKYSGSPAAVKLKASVSSMSITQRVATMRPSGCVLEHKQCASVWGLAVWRSFKVNQQRMHGRPAPATVYSRMPQIFFHGNVIGQGNASPQAAQGLLAKLGTALSSDPHAKEWSGGLVHAGRA
jgi:hypothetical protein